MAEDDPTIFDPSMKKKKKKKKTPFDLDAALSGESPSVENTDAADEPAQIETEKEKEAPDATDDLNLDDDFSNLTKKKKKKKKPFDLSELDEALPKEDKADTENDANTAAPVDDLDDLDLNFSTKKKKKKRAVIIDDAAAEEAEDADTTDGQKVSGNAWINSDRDYTYEELLKRVFDIMREKNPDMVAGERKKFNTKPPRVMRVGTKKTSFSNFKEICKALHRQPEHLLAFLFAELGTSGSIDGNDQLIIKGRFQQKQIENVLRSYIKEYVTCHTCKSRDTLLQKDTRLYFLQCETCGSRCSVTSIKSGFQAFTGKRAAIRAKTT